MGDPVSWMAIASIAGAGASVYSSVEASNEAKKQSREQAKALAEQKEEALKKGPEAVASSEEDKDIQSARRELLRKGFYSTLKTGQTGLGTSAQTAGTSLKGTLG